MLWLILLCTFFALPSIAIGTEDKNAFRKDFLKLPEDLYYVEHILAVKEYERTISLWEKLRNEGYELYGFYHTSIYQGQWREAMKEQLLLLDGQRRFPQHEDITAGRDDYAFYEYRHPDKRQDKDYESYRSSRSAHHRMRESHKQGGVGKAAHHHNQRHHNKETHTKRRLQQQQYERQSPNPQKSIFRSSKGRKQGWTEKLGSFFPAARQKTAEGDNDFRHEIEIMENYQHVMEYQSLWSSSKNKTLSSILNALNTTASKTELDYSIDSYVSLLELSSGFYFNVVGPDPSALTTVQHFVQSLNLRHYHKITFNFNVSFTRAEWEKLPSEEQKRHQDEGIYSCGEYPTMMAMRGFCRGMIQERDRLQREEVIEKKQANAGQVSPQQNSIQDYHYLDEASNDYIDRAISEKFHHLFDAAAWSASSKEVKKKRKALVFYFHLKGACCYKSKQDAVTNHLNPISRWREYMNVFNLEFPSICMHALTSPWSSNPTASSQSSESNNQGSYSTCGTDVKDGHYSGNFFWSTCDHVHSIPPLFTPFDWVQPEFIALLAAFSNELAAEYAKYCAYSAFNTAFGLYSHEVKRLHFLPTLWNLLISQVDIQQDNEGISKTLPLPVSMDSKTWPSLTKAFDPIKQPDYVKATLAGKKIFRTMNESTKMPALQFCQALRTPSQYLSLLQALPKDKVKDILDEKLKLPKQVIEQLLKFHSQGMMSSTATSNDILMPRVLYPELTEVLKHFTGLSN